jgi:hypothetical protein
MDILDRIEKGESSVYVTQSYIEIDDSNEEIEEAMKQDDVDRVELLRLSKLGKRMQWVSVADHLPKCSNEVDAWVRTSLGDEHRMPNLKFIKDHWEVYYDEVDRFEPLNSFYTVTHWMPLPPNPGEGDHI